MTGPTLTAEGCRRRRDRLMDAVDVDIIVISDAQNIQYFTGFHPPRPSLAERGPNHLIIDGGTGHTRLLVHNFAAGAAESAHVDEVSVWTWYNGGLARDAGKNLYPASLRELAAVLAPVSGGRLAVESGWFPQGAWTGESMDLSKAVSSLRRKKDDDELACIVFVQEVALAGHQEARKRLEPGMTELDLYSLIHAAMTETAGTPVHLIGDILSGPRILEVSGGPTRREIVPGDTVILDLSPVVGGFRADYTTTICLAPELSEAQAGLEDTLHEAMASGEAILRPGATAADVYRAVKTTMDDRGWGETFRHHAGHGLGLGHPEAPYFVPGSREFLLEGDVVTLEPGAYTAQAAGRIEHVYEIGADGPKRLTRHDTRFLR